MINLNLTALLGLFDLVLALFYLIASIVLPIYRRRFMGEIGTIFYVFQAILAPIILCLCGLIFIAQTWRLVEPDLLFAIFSLHVLIIYLLIKDLVISNLIYRRDRNP
jgi:hypothetical protein